ncbi:hypothetical protein C7999DRAFT_30493, partial [Corynascus novoguineensis]
MDIGKQLFGTRNKLRLGQIYAVWHFLNAIYNEGRTGYINALDTRLGKTMVALAIVAVLYTVELMGLLCRRDPGNYKLSDHFGYQHYVCQSGSLISAIHSRLAQGITVFLMPNTAVEGAEEAGRRFLEEVIQLPDRSNWDFVNVIGHESIGKLKGKLFGQPADTNIKIQVVKMPVSSGSRAKEAEFGNKKPKKNPFGSLNNDLKTYKSGADVQDIAIERIEFPADRNESILLDRADIATMFSRLALSGGFLSQLYRATFVHPFQLRKADVGQETLNIIN